MHPADKAVLRLAAGMALAVPIAYGSKVPAPFVACIMTVVVLCKPGPPLPLAKGLVAAAIVAVVLAVGMLMVPVLEHYQAAGVMLIAAVLYAVFLAGARKPNPLTMVLVIAFTVIPVAGVAEQALAAGLITALAVGLAIGMFVAGISHALFPDPPVAAAPVPATRSAGGPAARWSALQATLVVMPVFVLALTNPAFYLAAIMKTVALGQQAGAARAGGAGRELVGSTLAGAAMAAVVWFGLTLRPNLWMLALWLVAAAIWAGTRIFGVQRTSVAPSFWVNAIVTMFILLGPGIEDAAVGKDVYRASLTRVALFVGVAFYAWATVWAIGRWRARGAPLQAA